MSTIDERAKAMTADWDQLVIDGLRRQIARILERPIWGDTSPEAEEPPR